MTCNFTVISSERKEWMRGLLKDYSGQQCLRALCLKSQMTLPGRNYLSTSSMAFLASLAKGKDMNKQANNLNGIVFLGWLSPMSKNFFFKKITSSSGL